MSEDNQEKNESFEEVSENGINEEDMSGTDFQDAAEKTVESPEKDTPLQKVEEEHNNITQSEETEGLDTFDHMQKDVNTDTENELEKTPSLSAIDETNKKSTSTPLDSGIKDAASDDEDQISNHESHTDDDGDFVSQLKQMKVGKAEDSQTGDEEGKEDIGTIDNDKTLEEIEINKVAKVLNEAGDSQTQDQSDTIPPDLPPREEHSNTKLLPAHSLLNKDGSNKQRPNLPPRTNDSTSPAKFRRSMLQIHAVPPPLSEEYKSQRFLKNLQIIQAMPPADQQPNNGTSLSDHVEEIRINSAATSSDYDMIISRMNENSKNGASNQESVLESTSALKSTFKSIKDRFIGKKRHRESKVKDDETSEQPSDLDVYSEISYEEEEAKEINIDWPFWTTLVNDYEGTAQQEPEKLETEIAKGIPQQIRGVIWQLISKSNSKNITPLYNEMLAKEYEHENVIIRDLKRTNFIPHDRLDSLFNVLKAYANYDNEVGYTQGMGFITTPLLLETDSESDALGLLVRLMESYKVRSLFLPDMPGLMVMLYQFDRILEESSPTLYNHLTRQGVRSNMYATQWFLTFFGYKFPLEFVLIIFDIIFAEGVEALLKFAIALMLKNEDDLMALKFDSLLDYLKNDLFNSYLSPSHTEGILNSKSYAKKSKSSLSLFKTKTSSSDVNEETEETEKHILKYNVDEFVQDAMKIKIMPISLKRYKNEYAEIHEVEVQKEQQYESVRIQNKNLEVELEKVKRDFNALKQDHEAIANELIQKRLFIETVLDEKQDLEDQLQREKYKNSLPNPDSEIPNDLKNDLQKTMDRNMEVMNKNVELESEVSRLTQIIEDLQNKSNVSDLETNQTKNLKKKNSTPGSWKLFK